MAFASRNLAEHLLRGGIGFAALAAAVTVADARPVAALLLLVPAIVALRGCPICWTTGLIETIALRYLAHAADEPPAPQSRRLGEAHKSRS